jgi:hypothetical protein
MEKLTQTEELYVMEIAKFALSDGEIFDCMADKLDLSDNEMQNLRLKLAQILETT